MKRLLLSALAGLAMTAAVQAQAVQGVTDTEVRIGSHTDLSGIFAAFGAPATNAANLYFREINARGGVHGRQIRYIVEDHAYQMPRATQAINKLVNSDRVFAMLLALGTPMNLAAFRLQDERRIANIAPLTAARQMLQDPVDLKFVAFSSYYDQIRAGVRHLARTYSLRQVCSMYLPTDFGEEIRQGSREEAQAAGLAYVTETAHRPDEADFVGALTRLREAGCQIVGLALGVRQTITVVGTAKRLGWNDVRFITSSAGFHTAIAQVPGGVTEGLYASAGWSDIVARAEQPQVKAWIDAYRAAFNEAPSTGALLGRSAAEMLVRGLEAAGRNLTPDTFRRGMESLAYDDVIAGNRITFSATNHQGARLNVISVVRGGNWAEVTRVE